MSEEAKKIIKMIKKGILPPIETASNYGLQDLYSNKKQKKKKKK